MKEREGKEGFHSIAIQNDKRYKNKEEWERPRRRGTKLKAGLRGMNVGEKGEINGRGGETKTRRE